MGDGHYFINEPGLVVNKPIKFVGDENEPAHVVLEMSGEMLWESSGGWMEGITIRRPRISMGMTHNTEILRIEAGARLDMFNCVFDNRGSIGNCVSVMSDGAGGRWEKATINGGSRDYSGLLIEKNAKVELIDVSICKAEHISVCNARATQYSHLFYHTVLHMRKRWCWNNPWERRDSYDD